VASENTTHYSLLITHYSLLNSYNQIQLLALQQVGKPEAWKATGFILNLSQAFYLQLSIKQGFNTEAGTVFALRLSISYFYTYLNAWP
jgi:hypothetical protein